MDVLIDVSIGVSAMSFIVAAAFAEDKKSILPSAGVAMAAIGLGFGKMLDDAFYVANSWLIQVVVYYLIWLLLVFYDVKEKKALGFPVNKKLLVFPAYAFPLYYIVLRMFIGDCLSVCRACNRLL